MHMAISSNSQPRPVRAKFVHTEKLLAEVNKRVALTEDEAEILAHDYTFWIAPKNEDCEKVNPRKIGASQL